MTISALIQDERYEEKLQIAKNLLDILDDKMIALKCKLSINEVEELRKEEESKK